MKYSTTINHAGIASIDMISKTDLVDWCLLDYIANFESCENSKKLGDKVWLNFKHLISEMPMLGLNKKSSVSMRVKKLRELGLIETIQSVADQKLYAKTSELYKSAANFCVQTVRAEKQTVRQSEHKTDNNKHIKDFSSYPAGAQKIDEDIAGEKAEAIISLTSEQQSCFDWAVTHTFWHTATVCLKTFLHVYNFENGKLKAQFEANQKTRLPWTVDAFINDVVAKQHSKQSAGESHATGKYNRSSNLSRLDRSKQKCQQMLDNYHASLNIVN
jgi:hypothetical protein